MQKDRIDGGDIGGNGEANEMASVTSCDVYNSISPGIPFSRIPGTYF